MVLVVQNSVACYMPQLLNGLDWHHTGKTVSIVVTQQEGPGSDSQVRAFLCGIFFFSPDISVGSLQVPWKSS